MEIFNESFLWKRVLMALYTNTIILYKNYKEFTTGKDSPNVICDLKPEVFHQQISYLEEHKLIEIRDDDFYYLTNKGFNVAFELEKQSREKREKVRNEKGQFFIICLTTILAFTAMISFAKEVYPKLEELFFWIYFSLTIVLGFFMLRKSKKN